MKKALKDLFCKTNGQLIIQIQTKQISEEQSVYEHEYRKD